MARRREHHERGARRRPNDDWDHAEQQWTMPHAGAYGYYDQPYYQSPQGWWPHAEAYPQQGYPSHPHASAWQRPPHYPDGTGEYGAYNGHPYGGPSSWSGHPAYGYDLSNQGGYGAPRYQGQWSDGGPRERAPRRYAGPREAYRGRSRSPSDTMSGVRNYSSARNADGNGSRKGPEPAKAPEAKESELDDNPLGLPTQPRVRYLRQSLGLPDEFLFDAPLPKPLPLLVLDLNGTLVYRASRTSDRSRQPVLRPYLGNFLEYCLGLHVEQGKHAQRMKEWSEWDTKRRQEGTKQGEEKEDVAMSDAASPTPPSNASIHGSQCWSDANQEPLPLPGATYRLLIWSSAQPHNVDSMARAFLPPSQAEQLLRIYARDTLIIQKHYQHKALSVKDLEVVWATLNNADGREEQRARAEERVKAQTRFEQSQLPTDDESRVENELHSLWSDHLVLPQRTESGKGDDTPLPHADGVGYGPHNTMLLDDSMYKARLQPFNNILLPEFEKQRARVVAEHKKNKAKAGAIDSTDTEVNDELEELEEEPKDDKKKDKQPEQPEQPEDVLLQVIGVLEHARYQANISTWVRFGGLGDFGGMSAAHPDRFEANKAWHQLNAGLTQRQKLKPAEAKEIKKKWTAYFNMSLDKRTPQERASLPPQLHARLHLRTPEFWAREGERALLRLGIEPRMF